MITAEACKWFYVNGRDEVVAVAGVVAVEVVCCYGTCVLGYHVDEVKYQLQGGEVHGVFVGGKWGSVWMAPKGNPHQLQAEAHTW